MHIWQRGAVKTMCKEGNSSVANCMPLSGVEVSKASPFASSHELSVPCTRLSTWRMSVSSRRYTDLEQSSPQRIISAPSLPVFCCRLKTYFFELCYPQLLLSCPRSDTIMS